MQNIVNKYQKCFIKQTTYGNDTNNSFINI